MEINNETVAENNEPVVENNEPVVEDTVKQKKPAIKGILIVIALIAIGVVGFNIFSTMNATKRPIVSVSVSVADERMVTGEYSILGTLSPAKSASITSKISGRVNSVEVVKGDLVKAGALLVQLDDTDVQLQSGAGGMASDNVQKYKIAYELANDVYVKNKNLYVNGAIPQMTYEQSLASMQQAEIQYKTAATALAEQVQKTRITSPISGIVVAISVQQGDAVTQGAQLISIVNMDQVILKGTVPESIIGVLNQGQDVSVTVESLYGQSFKGKVSFISPVSVPAGQIFPVEISVSNVDNALMAGMTASATVKVETTTPVLAVPTSAVFERDGKKYVYVINSDQAIMTEVSIGMQNKAFTAINSGISVGSKVVSSDTAILMNGDQVIVK